MNGIAGVGPPSPGSQSYYGLYGKAVIRSFFKMHYPIPCVFLFVLNPMCVLIRAKCNWTEWKQRHRNPLLSTPSSSFHLSSPISPTRSIEWAAPPDGVIKFNFDGSLSQTGVAVGYLLWDSQGHLLQAGNRFMFEAPILVSEATALWDGLKAAKEAGFKHIQIDGDNQIFIQAVHGTIRIPWRIQILVLDIRDMLTFFTTTPIFHVFWEGNMAADWIAKRGCCLRMI